jgi:tRNA A-37 threonylcarbamoyl transferase component Bud32
MRGETPGQRGDFRGMAILEPLPTKGAEADIFIVEASGERRILKLYRHQMAPKIEVLQRVAEVSRRNRRCFVEFFETGFDEETGRWYEVQEYVPLGSLKDIPQTIKNSPGFIARLVPEMADAIHCLHENEIIHCDIKPANVLVRSLDPLDLVLTDFGISSILASDMSQKMTGLKGTPMYWAPEAFSREIGRPCDWWGMGIVVLELLAGENPFEGMSDSQIIHKLTLGNVSVPESLDPVWATLVKGLLTKDDSKRWGKAEIDRWASGDKSVPVFYSASREETGGAKPFQFEGREYRDEESLARAFAASESAWLAASGYLHYLRQWFEANLKFDEAMKMGQAESSGDPILALFRFVHGSARMPFSIMGRVPDKSSLAECVERYARGEAGGCDSKLVEMIGDGRLSKYCDEYASMSGTEAVAGISAVLEFMKGKSPREQRDCFVALRDTEAFLWPQGTDSSEESLVGAMASMGRVPLRRDYLSRIAPRYAIPACIASAISSGRAPEYAAAAATLESWDAKEMLIPLDLIGDSSAYERMSASEYEKMSRAVLFGHTAATLGQIGRISDELRRLYASNGTFATPVVADAIDKVNSLRDRKVVPGDTAFIMRVTKLLEEREGLLDSRWRTYCVWGLAAGFCAWLIHILGGRPGDVFLRWSLLVSLIANWILFHLKRSAMWNSPYDFLDEGFSVFILIYSSVIFIAPFITFDRILLWRHPHILTFSTGAVPTLIILFGVESMRLNRNSAKIMDACVAYDRSS